MGNAIAEIESMIGAADVRAIAMSRLIALEAEVNRLRDFLSMLDKFSPPPLPAETRPSKKTKCATPESALKAACIEVLREEKRPMGWLALCQAVEAKGYVVDGRSPRSRIVTAMWRAKPDVVHVDGGYVLASMWPSAPDADKVERGRLMPRCEDCGWPRHPHSARLCRTCYVARASARRAS